MMYNDILVPTDGTTEANAAITHALEHADTHTTIHALHTVNPGHLEQPYAGGDVATVRTLDADAEDYLEPLLKAASDAGIDATATIKYGSPATEIATYADENGIDLIVMSTHGRSGVTRVLNGSVTEAVIRKAETPVLALRRDDADQSTANA
jgi:nucleotide-binding universal stress UspA family protein